VLLSKCNIGSLMSFMCSFSLDSVSTKRKKMSMDVTTNYEVSMSLNVSL
jgi:hypothetical protein